MVFIVLSISDARRSDSSLADKEDEFVMMKIQERRLRQRAQLRKVIHRHLRVVDKHDIGIEVMDDEVRYGAGADYGWVVHYD